MVKLDNYAPVSESGCWIWLGSVDKDGYGKIGSSTKNLRAHRESWVHFKGPIPTGLCVLHKCDVRTCINPNHLFLGTRIDNHRDRDAKGRVSRGTKHYLSKLDEVLVRYIRSSSESTRELARTLGVSRRAIWQVRHNISWKHVT